MRRQLLTGLRMTVLLTIILGILYPLVITAVGQAAFSQQSNGSMVKNGAGKVVGSSLLAQPFTDAKGSAIAKYFQERPSAAGANGYDPAASGASNLGPSNPVLLDAVKQRAVAYRALNGLGPTTAVPVDAVTSSGSGLDPDITVANALLQAPRVARARSLPVATVIKAVNGHIRGRAWGFLGERTVNVLDLNLALDKA